MQVYSEKDYAALSARAARTIIAQVICKPDCVLGLATGSTPIGTYDIISDACARGEVSFKRVRTVNLDEYVGITSADSASYRAFMNEHLFHRIDIDMNNTHVPNGTADDPSAECARYDALIEALGGIDLQLLGIGHNGHIGFNEPAPYFTAGTHEVTLSENTRQANSIFFGGDFERVPKSALTLGIGGIMKAKKILLIASGEGKREALTRSLNGRIDPLVPASVLQMHRDVTVICDFNI